MNASIKSVFSLVIFLGFCLSPAPVIAVGAWSWMEESAMTKFTSEDLALLRTAAGEVLNNQPENTEISWSNPDTGNSGSATVTTTRSLNDMTCKNLLLKNSTKTLKGTAQYFLCQQADGSWEITSFQ